MWYTGKEATKQCLEEIMKRHYWYYTDLPVFEAAAKIRDTILPIFYKNMNELR